MDKTQALAEGNPHGNHLPVPFVHALPDGVIPHVPPGVIRRQRLGLGPERRQRLHRMERAHRAGRGPHMLAESAHL